MLEPQHKDFLLTLSAFFLRHRRESDALILVEAAALLEPKDREILKQLAYARLLAGDFEGCVQAITSWNISKTDHVPAAVHLLHSKALMGCGRQSEAQEVLKSYRQSLKQSASARE